MMCAAGGRPIRLAARSGKYGVPGRIFKSLKNQIEHLHDMNGKKVCRLLHQTPCHGMMFRSPFIPHAHCQMEHNASNGATLALSKFPCCPHVTTSCPRLDQSCLARLMVASVSVALAWIRLGLASATHAM